VYETAIGQPFEHVAVSARLKTHTAAEATRREPDSRDVLARARIKRERERAALQFAKDRDVGRLEATMARLDAEAQYAKAKEAKPNDPSVLAGLAGYLYAMQNGFVNPELLSWHQSGNALLMLILGGMGTLHGGAIGAAGLAPWSSPTSVRPPSE